MTTKEILNNAVEAKREFSVLDSEKKNKALLSMADAIEAGTEEILAANALDLESAKGTVSDVMLDRLMLNEQRIEDMANGIRELVKLPDPVGRILSEKTAANGIKITKISVPLGVVAIIYESRPNVTSDAAALCLKSSNVCVLRGGKEA